MGSMNGTLGEKIDALPTDLRELANLATTHMTEMSNRPHLDEYAETIASLLDALIAARTRGDTYKRVAAGRDALQAQVENLRNISNANGDWSVRYGQACDERDQIAQVCESLSAENETLRGNLKSVAVFYKDARGDLAELSVEWGYRDRDDPDWVTPEDERHARLMGDLHPDEIVTVRRFVGQWTEVIA